MTDEQLIRTNAIETAKQLALDGTAATGTSDIITEAGKIAAFVVDGTVPT